jgi:hypothetical protein
MSEESRSSNNLQSECLATFREWQPQFEEQFPNVRFNFWSSDEGPLPHAEARKNLFFSATRKTSPDTLDLQITFSSGPSPLSFDAFLLWGDEVGKIEMLLAEHPVSVLDPICENFGPILERFRDKMIACLVLGQPIPEPTETLAKS